MLLFERIIGDLNAKRIPYELLTHQASKSAQKASRMRQTPLEWGGKTLFLKGRDGFCLFALPANLEASSQKIRKILKSQKLRFATAREREELLGVPQGAIPPLGIPFQNFPLYLETSFLQNTKIAFTAGVLTQSIVMDLKDFLTLSHFSWATFSK